MMQSYHDRMDWLAHLKPGEKVALCFGENQWMIDRISSVTANREFLLESKTKLSYYGEAWKRCVDRVYIEPFDLRVLFKGKPQDDYSKNPEHRLRPHK